MERGIGDPGGGQDRGEGGEEELEGGEGGGGGEGREGQEGPGGGEEGGEVRGRRRRRRLGAKERVEVDEEDDAPGAREVGDRIGRH